MDDERALQLLREVIDDLTAEIQARAPGELPRRISRDMATVREGISALNHINNRLASMPTVPQKTPTIAADPAAVSVSLLLRSLDNAREKLRGMAKDFSRNVAHDINMVQANLGKLQDGIASLAHSRAPSATPSASEFTPTYYTIDHEKRLEAQHAAWMSVRMLSIRAHQICNLLRNQHPEIGELSDAGCLHQAIHDLLRVEWPEHSALIQEPVTNQGSTPQDDMHGYVDAFYRIAGALDIGGARAMSPKEFFHTLMLPRIELLRATHRIAASAGLLDVKADDGNQS